MRRWAAMADEGRVKELRAAARRYQLDIPQSYDAESILLELCVCTLQAARFSRELALGP